MKTKKSIAHFTKDEQEALTNLKEKLIEVYNPLLIHLIAIENSNSLKRDYLSYPIKTNKNGFTIDVLVIVPDSPILFSHLNEIDNIHCGVSEVNLLIYPLGQFHKELSEKSAFFYGIKKRAVVLYEHENTLEELSSYYFTSKILREELVKLKSLYPKYKDRKVNTLQFSNGKNLTEINSLFEVPILSDDLQYAFANFLKHHGAKTVNVALRKVILEYALSNAEVGVCNDFNETITHFDYLMKLFDLAESEYPASYDV